MATGVQSWSKTAATNASSDSAINWAEGQAPSSVNDSARAMMASTAKYRDDVNGSITTGGTSTAFTATSNQSFASESAMDGARLALKFSATSGASPTLAVDSLTARAIQTASGTAIPTGLILSGSIWDLTFVNSIPAWVIHGVPSALPAGFTVPANSVVTASITDANVTYAKIQNVTAARVLGSVAGSAPPSELTITNVLDLVGSAANGDILIRSGGSWTRLAIGASGTVLSSDGSAPSWGLTPAYFKIGATQTASSSSAITFSSSIDSTYREYVVGIDAAIPATDNVQFIMEVSVDGGSNWKTTSYISSLWGFTSSGASAAGGITTAVPLTRAALGNTSSYGYNGSVSLHNPSATGNKFFRVIGGYPQSGATVVESAHGTATYNGVTTAINAIRFRMSSGNIASGNFTLYGIK